MDPAAIIADLASPHLSMMQVAERHGLTLSTLAAFITSDQAQEQLDQLQSAAAIRTRLIAQLHLPIAAAALSAILQSHRAASFPAATATQHTDPLGIAAREESPPGDHARPAAPPSPQEPDQSHSSLDAAPPPPASSHASAPPATSPSIDHARTLRHEIELRRAAATLLRFATFNHRHLARAASDSQRNATSPRDPSSSHNPISPRAKAPSEQPQHIAHTAAPSGITLDPSPATPHTRAINTNPFAALSNHRDPAAFNPIASSFAASPSPFTSFASLLAAAIAAADDVTGDANDVSPGREANHATNPVPDLAPSHDTSSGASSLPAARHPPPHLTPRRPSAATRLASSAGASTHPP
ncbi:MAG: hypothetical protein KF859_12855 [Phycisphaeraceae bacterium]|nr:hypothetical protein [Phycisphaeraceae bacterium]